MTNKTLSADEEQVMKMTFKATMLRAAEVVERITHDDVMNAQWELRQKGASLQQLARIDRATLAVAHLRACAERGE